MASREKENLSFGAAETLSQQIDVFDENRFSSVGHDGDEISCAPPCRSCDNSSELLLDFSYFDEISRSFS